jgi:uncharacterized protein (TIGR00725 family)
VSYGPTFHPMIAVIGGDRCSAEERTQAEAVGRELAARGAALICGGRGGVMEAACRGALRAGGLTIGVLPGDDRSQANPYVAVPIVTGMGEARNAIIVNSAQGVIAVGGEYGTLSEIAFALKRGLPVAGLSTWELARAERAVDALYRADSPEEAVRWVLEQVGGRAEQRER